MKVNYKKYLSKLPFVLFFILGLVVGFLMNRSKPQEFKNPEVTPYVKGPTTPPPQP